MSFFASEINALKSLLEGADEDYLAAIPESFDQLKKIRKLPEKSHEDIKRELLEFFQELLMPTDERPFIHQTADFFNKLKKIDSAIDDGAIDDGAIEEWNTFLKDFFSPLDIKKTVWFSYEFDFQQFESNFIERLQNIFAQPHNFDSDFDKITSFLKSHKRELLPFVRDKSRVVNFLVYDLKKFSPKTVSEFLEKLYASPYVRLNDENSAACALLTLIHGCSFHAEDIHFDYVQEIIQLDKGNNAPISCLDAIELMVKATSFALENKDNYVLEEALKTDEGVFYPRMFTQELALKALAGNLENQGFKIDTSRRATKGEFERISHIVEEMVGNLNPHFDPLVSLGYWIFEDQISERQDPNLLSHQQNLFALALYKLCENQGLDDGQLLTYTAEGLRHHAAQLGRGYNERDVDALFSEIGQTFDYAPLKRFGRSSVMGRDPVF